MLTRSGFFTMRPDFLALLPDRPYCTTDAETGVCIRSRQRAASFPIVQHNSPIVWRWMVFDLDMDDSHGRVADSGIPAPTYIAINRQNGHAHAAWQLLEPVTNFSTSRQSPVSFYRAVERGMTRRLGADRNYTGFISKNPMHPKWEVDWQASAPYELHRLNDCLTSEDKKPWERRNPSEISAGRNCTLFDDLRRAAYRLMSHHKNYDEFLNSVESIAAQINAQFSIPLLEQEVWATTKSVAKWTWKNYDPRNQTRNVSPEFSALQSFRVKHRYQSPAFLAARRPWLLKPDGSGITIKQDE